VISRTGNTIDVEEDHFLQVLSKQGWKRSVEPVKPVEEEYVKPKIKSQRKYK
jgi:hypothetical protein